jgi:peptidoglycan/xylan/chitin deacetylase (PgdA/CDA1 family)
VSRLVLLLYPGGREFLRNLSLRIRARRPRWPVAFGLGVVLASALIGSLGGDVRSAGAAAVGQTVVSLEFDDGNADLYSLHTMLSSHGMRGTFFINSPRIGLPGYLTTAQLQAIAADGNEIAGHTLGHTDLPTLTVDEQKREVCDDRVALANMGFTTTNFAYPFGDYNATTKQIVAACGYNSARTIGGIHDGTSCSGCPNAESIPPFDPFVTATPSSVKTTTTLASLQALVTQAEARGGGWIQIVMHHVCDNCAQTYAISPAVLSSFLDWLQLRAASGTVVKTVADVIGGPVKPLVAGPPLPPPSTGTNVIQNSSLEADANVDGVPDCWMLGGYGINTFKWTRTSDAHTGLWAERVDVSAYTGGDRKLVGLQDVGACAPAVKPGHSYVLRLWYKSDQPTRMGAFDRTAAGWSYWADGPALPPASTWTQATWTTPVLPSAALSLSFGDILKAVGYLTVDDLTMADSDQTPPTVSMTAPLDGTSVPGPVALTATASDTGGPAAGIDHVDFLVNGVVVGRTAAAPYSVTWDPATVSGSSASIAARAVDTAGNATTSPSVMVTLGAASVDLPPTVSLTAPADGATVSSAVLLSANASDDHGVDHVDFLVDGVVVGTASTPPYEYTWDPSAHAAGPATIAAVAFDRATHSTTSTAVTVAVTRPIAGGPTISLTAPAVSGLTTLTLDPPGAVDHVDFLVDGVLVGSDATAAYSVGWNTTTHANGLATVTARAVDTTGGQTNVVRTMTVAN